MGRQRSAPEPRTDLHPRAHLCAGPLLAAFAGQASWLEGTILALGVVLVLGALASVFVAVGRRLRWWSTPDLIRVKRSLRIAFGALFLGALVLPYLIVRLPVLAAVLLVFGLAALVWYPAAEPQGLSRREHSTGEHSDL